jgi:PleD family two-component response regulator
MNEPAASILVADDDRTIRQNLVKLLKAEGYRPLEACDGEQALARIAADSPDAGV